jgi:DNA repair exonuclease SbcCD ATPase subunit
VIIRVSLVNWRAYEQLELTLRRGTTFVVARNGIGKTSLLEGVTWALYGDAGRRPEGAVRLGHKSASASVDVQLPDGRMLSVTRELPRRLAKNRAATVAATVDDQILSEAELDSLIRNAFQADPAFLSRVTMLERRDLEADASTLNLQEHLSRFFGIDSLQGALDELRARKKSTEGEIRNIKQTVGISAARLKELRGRRDGAEDMAQAAEISQQEAQQAADATAQALKQAEAYTAWRQREEERLQAVGQIASQVASLLGASVRAEDLPAALDRLDDEATRRLDELRREQGLLLGRISAVETALAQLVEEAGVCPVCRRPLTIEEATHARSGHDKELEEMRRQLTRHDDTPHLERLEFVRETRRRLNALAAADIVEPVPTLSVGDAKVKNSAAQDELKQAREHWIEQRAQVMAATRELEAAQSDQRASELLKEKFRVLGLITVAIDAVDSTISGVLDRTIDPLKREVADRWKRLFANRGPLQVTGQGDLSREMLGEELPFVSFSTGEKMAAQMLLRLLILDSATNAPFCWLDEPLEHLDPDARRQVASMLAVIPATTSMEQVLVTTYEEPLARRLAERMAGDVDLVYVRAG